MRSMLRAPVFIVGLNKSGTSLLYLLLSRQPGLSGLRGASDKVKTGSARLNLTDYGLIEGHKLEGLPRRLRPSQSSNLFASPKTVDSYRLTEIDAQDGDRHMAEAAYRSAMIDPELRLVEKSPPNLIRTRYLQALFPDSSFVAIVRDPYANVSANAKKRTKWGSVSEQAAHWNAAYTQFLADRTKLKRCMTVQYETLVSDPAPTLKRICAFCALAFDEEMLADFKIVKNINHDLKSLLTPEEVEAVYRIINPWTLRKLGYANIWETLSRSLIYNWDEE